MDGIEAWHLWVVAGLVAGAVEIIRTRFVLLWFAIGAFAASLAAGFGWSVLGQLGVFALLSTGLVAVAKTVLRDVFRPPPEEAENTAAPPPAQADSELDRRSGT